MECGTRQINKLHDICGQGSRTHLEKKSLSTDDTLRFFCVTRHLHRRKIIKGWRALRNQILVNALKCEFFHFSVFGREENSLRLIYMRVLHKLSMHLLYKLLIFPSSLRYSRPYIVHSHATSGRFHSEKGKFYGRMCNLCWFPCMRGRGLRREKKIPKFHLIF